MCCNRLRWSDPVPPPATMGAFIDHATTNYSSIEILLVGILGLAQFSHVLH